MINCLVYITLIGNCKDFSQKIIYNTLIIRQLFLELCLERTYVRSIQPTIIKLSLWYVFDRFFDGILRWNWTQNQYIQEFETEKEEDEKWLAIASSWLWSYFWSESLISFSIKKDCRYSYVTAKNYFSLLYSQLNLLWDV